MLCISAVSVVTSPFWGNATHIFHRGFAIPHSHQQCTRVPISSHPYQHPVFLNFSSPSVYEVIVHCSFDLHFPNDQRYWATFHVLIGHLYISLEKYLFRSLADFYFFFSFSSLVVGVIYIFWILYPYQYMIWKYFFYRLSFHFLDSVLYALKF